MSRQIRLQRVTLAHSLVTGGALWSCNQEPSSWMCIPTMRLYKLRWPLKCEKRGAGTLLVSCWTVLQYFCPIYVSVFIPLFVYVFSLAPKIFLVYTAAHVVQGLECVCFFCVFFYLFKSNPAQICKQVAPVFMQCQSHSHCWIKNSSQLVLCLIFLCPITKGELPAIPPQTCINANYVKNVDEKDQSLSLCGCRSNQITEEKAACVHVQATWSLVCAYMFKQ